MRTLCENCVFMLSARRSFPKHSTCRCTPCAPDSRNTLDVPSFHTAALLTFALLFPSSIFSFFFFFRFGFSPTLSFLGPSMMLVAATLFGLMAAMMYTNVHTHAWCGIPYTVVKWTFYTVMVSLKHDTSYCVLRTCCVRSHTSS